MDEELTVEQAAAELGMSPAGVRRRIQRGDLRARRIGARVLVIARADVELWKARGRLRPGPKPGSRRKRGGDEAQTRQEGQEGHGTTHDE